MPASTPDSLFDTPDEAYNEEEIRAELEALTKRREELTSTFLEAPSGSDFIEASQIFRRIRQLERILGEIARQERSKPVVQRRSTNRSPSYPACDLKRSVEFAVTLHARIRNDYTTYEAAIGFFGYSPRSSSGQRTMAALSHFGLTDERGTGPARQIRLSKLGRRIALEAEARTADYYEAIQQAVLQPRVYTLLWERWGDHLPDQQELTTYLVDELAFNPNSVDTFLADYRSSLVFAGLLDRETRPEHVQSVNRQLSRLTSEPRAERSGDPPLEISVPLTSGERATLRIPTALTGADFDLLAPLLNANLLQAMKRANSARKSSHDEPGSRSAAS